MSGPTPSPATNELLALAAAGSPDLKARAQQRLTETRQALAQFLSAEHPEGFADEVAEIEAQFTAYAAALEGLAAGRDESQALQEASLALRRAMNFYEDEQLSRGPTRFRPYNLIANLSGHYRAGKVDPVAWQGTCEHWAHFHRKVIEEIDNSQAKNDPGVPQRRASAAKAVQALETLAQTQDHDAPLALFLEAHEGLEAALAEYNDFALGSGPTPSPQANLVLNLARGKFEQKTLEEAAFAMHEKVRAGMAEFQRLTREKVEAPVLLEQYPRMFDALEMLDDTLQLIVKDRRNEGALKDFEVAARELDEATRAIQHYQGTLGKIPCPNCQAYNAPGTRFCEGCQRSLPQVATGAGYGSVASTLQVMEGAEADGLPPGPIFTEKMKILNDACIALDRGEMELEAFLELLDRCEDECNAAEEGLAHMQAPEIPEEATDEEALMAQEFVDLAEDALSLLSYGVGECLAGLQQLRECAQQGKGVVAMEEGARLYFEGIQKLYQVERLDEGFQRTLRSLKTEEPPESDSPVVEDDPQLA